MKPVDCQTADDCLVACLESVLELPQGTLPRSGSPWGSDWTAPVAGLLEPYDVVVVELTWSPHLGTLLPLLGYYILTGPCRPGGRRHSVVAYAGQMVHDPNPSRNGIVDDPSNWTVALIVPKDPAR